MEVTKWGNINSQPELALIVCIVLFDPHKESARQRNLRFAKGYQAERRMVIARSWR